MCELLARRRLGDESGLVFVNRCIHVTVFHWYIKKYPPVSHLDIIISVDLFSQQCTGSSNVDCDMTLIHVQCVLCRKMESKWISVDRHLKSGSSQPWSGHIGMSSGVCLQCLAFFPSFVENFSLINLESFNIGVVIFQWKQKYRNANF